MKSFRTEKTLFDIMMDDCEPGIPEKLRDNAQADAVNVRQLTFARLGIKADTTAKPKKIKRRLTFSLIAAAAALTLIGSAVVGASEGFAPAFSEYIAGEPANGVFSGGNVHKSSDIVNIDFHGVTGDEHTAAVSMTLTKKDGTPFISDTADTFTEVFSRYCPYEESWLHDPDDPDPVSHFGSKYYEQEYECTKPVTHSLKNMMGQRSDNEGMTQLDYSFKDNRTIKLYAEYMNDDINIKGQKLTLRLKNLYVSRIDKVLYSADTYKGPGEWQQFSQNPETYEKLNKKYKDQLGEDQSIRISTDWNQIIIATRYVIPLNYEITLDLNYRTVTRELIPNEKKAVLDGEAYTLKSLNAGSYSIELKTAAENSVYEKLNDKSFDQLVILLSSGVTVIADMNSGSGGSTDEKQGFYDTRFEYYEKSDYDKGRLIRYALDPDDIVSVKYHGNELFGQK